MVRRSLALVGVVVAVLLLVAPAASAQYADDGSITVNPDNPDPGDAITVTGTACGEPGVDVTVSITQGGQTIVIGTATTGPDGSYTVTGSVPANFVDGVATVSDTCGASYTLNIGDVAVGAAALPRTGSETGTMWRVAVALVAIGGILVLTARKRTAKVAVDA